MLELKVTPDRNNARAMIQHIVAKNIEYESGSYLISLPMGVDDSDQCALYFDAEQVDEPLLEVARSLLRDLDRLDNAVQASCVDSCRKSGLHPRAFESALAFMTLRADSVVLHYHGTGVNTEWDELARLEGGVWIHAGMYSEAIPPPAG